MHAQKETVSVKPLPSFFFAFTFYTRSESSRLSLSLSFVEHLHFGILIPTLSIFGTPTHYWMAPNSRTKSTATDAFVSLCNSFAFIARDQLKGNYIIINALVIRNKSSNMCVNRRHAPATSDIFRSMRKCTWTVFGTQSVNFYLRIPIDFNSYEIEREFCCYCFVTFTHTHIFCEGKTLSYLYVIVTVTEAFPFIY